ncbi:MAG: glucose-1-phosphate adenylyltransferase [Bacilli bacterium]
MANENEVVAMLLAGGKGTRLKDLTKKSAKPGVPFGGKYRIIDFPMSNIANSDINIVGVMTQYESTFLNSYIGNGDKWGLNGVRALTATLTPRQTEQGSNWYNGTADAIYQNIDFLDEQNPRYVLILSGDHIYKMDYRKMLSSHIKAEADLTIAVIDVSLKEASRFGILKTDENGDVTAFIEKPKNPPSTLASMGIYIFNYDVLRRELIKDAKNPQSNRDFGQDIIPEMLRNQNKIHAYTFQGYWKDVGTVNSLWEANMDLLASGLDSEIYRDLDGLTIYTEDTKSVPQYIGKNAKVIDSIVNQGAIILGEVYHSIISNEVFIAEDATVSDSVIMPNVIIPEAATIEYAIIDSEAVLQTGASYIGTADNILLIHGKDGF